MAKIKKRSLSEDSAATKNENNALTGAQQKHNKKKKIDTTNNSNNKTALNKVEKSAAVQNGKGDTATKTSKRKQKKHAKQKDNSASPQKVSEELSEKDALNKKGEDQASTKTSAKGIDTSSTVEKSADEKKIEKHQERQKKRKLAQIKKKQLARQKRKEDRALNGTYQVKSADLDAIQAKITNIESRETLSKTAIRNLAALKKRLKVLQGGAASVAKKSDTNTKPTNTKKAVTVLKTEKLDKPILIEQIGKRQQIKKVNKDQKKMQDQTQQSHKAKPIEEEKDDDESESEDEDKQRIDRLFKQSEDSMEVDNEDDDTEEDAADEEIEGEESDDGEIEDEEGDDEEGEEDKADSDEEDEEEDDDNSEEEVEEKKPNNKKVAEKDLGQKDQAKKDKRGSQTVSQPENKRYVLFIGNLPYTVKPEEIKKHFLTKVSAVTSVRVPTKKGSDKPLGIAYIEFANNTDYEKGLTFHHTFIGGRRINVQYTTTGSKHISKKQDVVAKNQKLHALRKMGKLAGSKPNKKFVKKQQKA